MKQTRSAEHPTPNLEWRTVREEASHEYKANGKTPNAQAARLTRKQQPIEKKTSNAERRTSNAEFLDVVLRIQESPCSDNPDQKPRKYDLEDRLLKFAAEVIELTETLPNTRAANHIASQLLRSGTSPFGNHGELESAESRKDFIHKLKICLKELRETRRWLRLLTQLKKIKPPAALAKCLIESEELIRIFVSSVRTAERNIK